MAPAEQFRFPARFGGEGHVGPLYEIHSPDAVTGIAAAIERAGSSGRVAMALHIPVNVRATVSVAKDVLLAATQAAAAPALHDGARRAARRRLDDRPRLHKLGTPSHH